MKNQKAITLVALIITVIVLLILATVSINLVINSGIITKTKSAVDKYSEEEKKEKIKLLATEIQMQQLYGKSQEEALRSVVTSHDSNAQVTKSNAIYEVTYMGEDLLIGNDLRLIEKVEANTDEWTFNESTGALTAYIGDLTKKRGNQEIGEVIIPNYYNGERVKILKGRLFYKNLDLSKIIISDGIEEIEGWSFMGCDNLKGDLIIPDSIIKIGGGAFHGCGRLDGILKLSNNLQKIEINTFFSCKNISGEVIIPKSISLIDNKGFIRM